MLFIVYYRIIQKTVEKNESKRRMPLISTDFFADRNLYGRNGKGREANESETETRKTTVIM